MPDPITWTFKLLDKVSGPVGSARRGVGDFIQTLHSGMAVVGMLGDVAARTGQALSDALEPARFKESTTVGLGVLLRDSEKAARLYQEAVKFAAATPFETRQVVDSYQKLLVAGFKETEIPIVLKGVGDLGAIKGFSQEVIDRITMAFGQIKAKGKLSGEELMQLAESGVPLGRVYETLGKIFGKTTDEIRKMQEAGQIGADEGIFAVMKVLRDDIGGGKLGNVMGMISRTLDGIVSTLKSRPFEYLQELVDTPGYARVRDALGAISDALDTATPKGQKLLGVVKEFGDGLLDRLFGRLDEGNVDQILDQIITSMEWLKSATLGFLDGLIETLGPMDALGGKDVDMKAVAESFREMGRAAGTVTEAILGMTSAIGGFFAKWYEFGQWTVDHPWALRLLTTLGGAALGAVGGAAAGGIGAVPGLVLGGVAGALAPGALEKLAYSSVGAKHGLDEGDGRSIFAKASTDQADYERLYRAGMRSSTPTGYIGGFAIYGMGEEVGGHVGDGLVAGLDKGLRSSLEVRSPSRVTDEIGYDVGGHAGDGLARGMRRGLSDVSGGGAFAPAIHITVPAGTSRSLVDEVAAVVSSVLAAQFEAYMLQLGRAT